MALKAYNNGIQAKEIRCVDAGGVERIIREIRKGDVQWWRGEFDPPTIKGTWTKVEDGLYQTKAVIPSYTTPDFLAYDVNTNYVIVSFHSYENTVTCEFFGDFEGVDVKPLGGGNGLNGEFYFNYSWADASGTGVQSYTCGINVFPKANGMVTSCEHSSTEGRPRFTEDSAFVDEYGDGWIVQGTAAHNKMCSDAFGYYTDKTVDPWGIYGRRDNTWYNETYSGVTNYICADNGRAFSVKVLSGSVSLVFCPPGGSAAGWVASEDSKFPASSGWYQKAKKDGYTKFFNTSNGRFVEYLPKESFYDYTLSIVRSSIGSNLSDSEYENRVVCTAFNATHLETSSKVAESKTNSDIVSDYDSEYYFDVYGIPLVNLTTGEYIFGHYNPSVPFVEFTVDETSCRYTVSGGILFNAVITTTLSNGNTTIGLELNQNAGFSPNTFLTGTYPQAKYMYEFDSSNDEYTSLIIACIAANGSDVVGDFHEYRLPADATYELKTVSLVANGGTSSFNPASGYVLGTGYFSDTDTTFRFVIRPASTMNTNYHQIVFNHTNVSTSANSKALEISANLSYFGTTTYSRPQDNLADDRKLVPVYWRMGAEPGDRLNSSYDGSRYMTSSSLYCKITLSCDWDPDNKTYTDSWYGAHYILPIATATPMTVAKATFMADALTMGADLPGIGYVIRLMNLQDHPLTISTTATQSIATNGIMTITLNRSTGVVTCTSNAKDYLPELPAGSSWSFTKGYTSGPNVIYCYGHPDGRIALEMWTGKWKFY